jgi:hypothetical protein
MVLLKRITKHYSHSDMANQTSELPMLQLYS